jgi:hypothetical protein
MRIIRSAVMFLVLYGVAACGALDEQVASPTATETTVTLSASRMTVSDRLRAISSRSRMARDFKAPRESIERQYSKDGRVLVERVFQRGKWSERPSTLPAEIAARPLVSFIQGRGSASAGSLLFAASRNAVDTAGGLIVTVADTLWNSSTYQTATRDSDEPTIQSVQDIYYDESADVGAVELSTSGYALSIDAVGDEFVEMEWGSSEWPTVVSDFAAAVDEASLRMPLAIRPTIAESTDNVLHALDGTPVMASTMLEQSNCANFRHGAKGFFGVAALAILGSVAVIACPVCALGYGAAVISTLGKVAIGAGVSYVGSRIAYHSCENS